MQLLKHAFSINIGPINKILKLLHDNITLLCDNTTPILNIFLISLFIIMQSFFITAISAIIQSKLTLFLHMLASIAALFAFACCLSKITRNYFAWPYV